MCQNNCTTKSRKFKQLTYKDRIKIEVLYNKEKRTFTEIAEILGFHRTTISRDIRKRTSGSARYRMENKTGIQFGFCTKEK